VEVLCYMDLGGFSYKANFRVTNISKFQVHGSVHRYDNFE